jgi:uncharacterized membrane protein
VNIKHILTNLKAGIKSPSSFFILIAGLFGLGFIILIPPFQNPDEVVHFYRAYQVSNLQITGQKIGSSVGGDIPRSIVETVDENTKGTHGTLINFNDNEKYRKSVLKQSLKKPLNKEDTVKIVFPNSAINSPFTYLPQSLGIAFGKILNLSPVLLLYLGRLFGLAFFILCVFYAIKLIPHNKWVYAGVACLPMVLAQASSITGDTVVYSSVFIIMASILYAQKNRLSMKMLVVLTACFVLMSVSKQVFILLAPLLLLVPRKFMPHKVNKGIYISVVLVVMAICFAGWQYLSAASGAADATIGSPGSNMNAQKEMLIHYPEVGVNAMARTFLTPYGDDIYVSFAGNFGWLHAPLPLYAVATVYVLLSILLFVRYEKEVVPRRLKLYNSTLIVIAVAIVAATAGALYLSFTPLGDMLLRGFQGRYVIPSVIVVAGIVYSSRAIRIPMTQYRSVVQILTVVVLAISMCVVFGRFYLV